MNTYRVYVLDTTAALAPVVHIAYVRTDKYSGQGGAWDIAGAIVRRDEKAKKLNLYADPGCTEEYGDWAGDVKVVKIVDIRPRNVKLDKKALQELIADPNTPDDEKLKALADLLGA